MQYWEPGGHLWSPRVLGASLPLALLRHWRWQPGSLIPCRLPDLDFDFPNLPTNRTVKVGSGDRASWREAPLRQEHEVLAQVLQRLGRQVGHGQGLCLFGEELWP